MWHWHIYQKMEYAWVRPSWLSQVAWGSFKGDIKSRPGWILLPNRLHDKIQAARFLEVVRMWNITATIPGINFLQAFLGENWALRWASHVAQLVKNLPAMQETLVPFLGEEGLLEKGQTTHYSIGFPW